MANTKAVFCHRTLRDGDIRLLRFDKDWKEKNCSEHQDSTLIIDHFPHQRVPPYVALSYEWGDASESRKIYVGGRTFGVRRNLWWCLRFIARFYDCQYLWVDAICIDQDNLPERNEQVRNMGRIYANAATVLVWLGIEYEDTYTEEYRTGVSTYNPGNWDRRLLERSYWSRMWIIQELLLARKVEILDGLRVITWNEVLGSIESGNNMSEFVTPGFPKDLEITPFSIRTSD